MDKQWRNLVILVVIIFVFSIIYILATNPNLIFIEFDPAPSENVELGTAFLEVAELSENKGLDFNNLIYGSLITFNEDGTYDYAREEILDFNSSLQPLIDSQKEKLSGDDFEYFSDVTSLIQQKIYLYDAYYGLLWSAENIDLATFCEDLDMVGEDLLPRAELVFELFNSFNENTLLISEKYNISLILINSDFEQNIELLENLTNNLEEAVGICLDGVDDE